MNPPSVRVHGFSAIILAGGASSRMGRDKAWILSRGRSLLLRQVALAREVGAREVWVSGRPGVDYAVTGLPVLLDREPGQGPLAGIERGLEVAAWNLLLVLAVDLPRLEPVVIHRLASHCRDGQGAVPVVEGRIEPVAAIYPRELLSLARDHLARGQRSLTKFVEAGVQAQRLVWVSFGPEFTDHFTNWNTPGDVTPDSGSMEGK